ncbi:MAG: UDP-N-acetylmuramoyl-tripeptide--D-alanyl-D-alanine ligase [Candidatus Symbiobacter sp.]|nr:UDP-N-acetylmuramoyl-tripeptide--D-alanyl-D-alanine ligase [Candidatus Symbiobacter sp.]
MTSKLPPLWLGSEIVAALGQASLGQASLGQASLGQASLGDFTATGVSIDSRTLAAGDIFVALQGENFDGHDYIDAAMTAGAVAVIAQRLPASGVPKMPYFLVSDSLAALRDLGRLARRRLSPTAKILALTGSVGKTSTKTALVGLLAHYGKTHTAFGNFNNHIGVPLSLARMPRDTEFAVFEIGTSNPGEILPLAQLVAPQFVLIGTIASAHVQFFGSEAEIAKEKGFLIEGIAVPSLATVILDRDSKYFDYLSGRAQQFGVKNIVSFGNHSDADFQFSSNNPDPFVVVHINAKGRKFSYEIPSVGEHHIRISVTALAAFAAMCPNTDLAEAAQNFVTYEPIAGRGKLYDLELSHGRKIRLIDDSYNASPISMQAAITQIAFMPPPQTGGRKIAVLGDMLEIGGHSRLEHEKLGRQIAQATSGIDTVYTAGKDSELIQHHIKPEQIGEHGETSSELLPILLDETTGLKDGDLVLAKGSHGSNIYKLVAALIAAGTPNHQNLSGGKNA